MTDEEEAREDQEVAEMAVAALTAAQQRAMQSGRDVVLVENGQLIRRTPTGDIVLRVLPPNPPVTERIKQARS